MRARLHEAFVSGYQRKFGRTPPSVAVELVTLRVSAQAPALRSGRTLFVPTDTAPAAHASAARQVYFPELGGFAETPVLRRTDLPRGFQAAGPLLIEDSSSTLAIGPQARVALSQSGNLIVDLAPSHP